MKPWYRATACIESMKIKYFTLLIMKPVYKANSKGINTTALKINYMAMILYKRYIKPIIKKSVKLYWCNWFN